MVHQDRDVRNLRRMQQQVRERNPVHGKNERARRRRAGRALRLDGVQIGGEIAAVRRNGDHSKRSRFLRNRVRKRLHMFTSTYYIASARMSTFRDTLDGNGREGVIP